jgi:three-Cys-motif partner protein
MRLKGLLMPPKVHPTVWEAAPHTVAKIAILEGYLQAWFPILGRGAYQLPLLYIDGFAGPGKYTNHDIGSPIAAVRAAHRALEASGNAWKAGDIHCAFIEEDRLRCEHLDTYLEPYRASPRLHTYLYNETFVDGIKEIKKAMPLQFAGAAPLFVFIDPFGATGVPFTVVSDILRSPRSEVLFNFDVDAVVRIFQAGASASHERILTEVFGDDTWRDALAQGGNFSERCQRALDLYKSKLLKVPNVRYVFSFGMGKTPSTVDYYLIFATQHPLGQEKMKEAMRRIDQAGDYRFSDSHVQSPMLFRFDQPSDFALRMLDHFAGQTVKYSEVRDYALNGTPFVNPKGMLAILDKLGHLDVASIRSKRRVGTFPDNTIRSIHFGERHEDGQEKQHRVDKHDMESRYRM